MATILAHIHIKEGREEEFEEIARTLHAATFEHESGVKHYEYWRGAAPSLYYCLLAFDDYHAFLSHQTSDHHESASPKLGDLIDDMKLEWVDPVDGASKLPATKMQELPAGANDLTKLYYKLFAATVQDWWQGHRGSTGD